MYFKVFKDKANQWRWLLQSDKQNIIAVSGEGYPSKDECYHGVELVRDAFIAPVLEPFHS